MRCSLCTQGNSADAGKLQADRDTGTILPVCVGHTTYDLERYRHYPLPLSDKDLEAYQLETLDYVFPRA